MAVSDEFKHLLGKDFSEDEIPVIRAISNIWEWQKAYAPLEIFKDLESKYSKDNDWVQDSLLYDLGIEVDIPSESTDLPNFDIPENYIFVISGLTNSGKSTLAEDIRKVMWSLGYITFITPLATQLKEMVTVQLEISPEELEVKKRSQPDIRRFMENFADRMKRVFGEDYFVRCLVDSLCEKIKEAKAITELNPMYNQRRFCFIIPDIRFLVEDSVFSNLEPEELDFEKFKVVKLYLKSENETDEELPSEYDLAILKTSGTFQFVEHWTKRNTEC